MESQIQTTRVAEHSSQTSAEPALSRTREHVSDSSDDSQMLLDVLKLSLSCQHGSTDNACFDAAIEQSPDALEGELRALPAAQRLYESGDYVVAVAHRFQTPSIVLEIGRLREVAFRAVGEGTGRDLDLDRFDDYYQHLFVWSRSKRQVQGSYRLAMSDIVRRAMGCSGLYTHSLFKYDDAFLDGLGPAIELGRSFVRVECQRSSRVLAMLWKGIGTIVAMRPVCCNLFGPVSVSASYSDASRELIAASLSRGDYRHPLTSCVEPLRPVGEQLVSNLVVNPSLQHLSDSVSELETDGKGLPTLVREYIKLSGRFLAFSIDPDFGSAMDGLVAVDLRRTNSRLLALYMGPDAYDRFRQAAPPLSEAPWSAVSEIV